MNKHPIRTGTVMALGAVVALYIVGSMPIWKLYAMFADPETRVTLWNVWYSVPDIYHYIKIGRTAQVISENIGNAALLTFVVAVGAALGRLFCWCLWEWEPHAKGRWPRR
jgi:ABC-type glycerol-3-phosphate transport system permease component